jgi:hypothetical protein
MRIRCERLLGEVMPRPTGAADEAAQALLHDDERLDHGCLRILHADQRRASFGEFRVETGKVGESGEEFLNQVIRGNAPQGGVKAPPPGPRWSGT